MNERQFKREVAAHKHRVRQQRTKLQQQLAAIGYYTKTPEEAEALARRLAVRH